MSILSNHAGERGEPGLISLNLWLQRHWWRIITIAIVGAAGSYLYTRRIPPEYTAVVTFIPAGKLSASGSAGSGLAGLAGIAGISSGGMDQTKVGTTLLASRSFIDGFIERHGLLPVLLPNHTIGRTPTPEQREEGFQRLSARMSLDQPTANDALRLELRWPEPVGAARSANSLIADLNTVLRRRAIVNASQRKIYLEAELSRTPVAELRFAIADMVTDELHTLMSARQPIDFAFEVLDPAVPPTKASWPRPVLLAGVGGIFGALLGVLWSITADVRRRQ